MIRRTTYVLEGERLRQSEKDRQWKIVSTYFKIFFFLLKKKNDTRGKDFFSV
jgi:hypothetical protein